MIFDDLGSLFLFTYLYFIFIYRLVCEAEFEFSKHLNIYEVVLVHS